MKLIADLHVHTVSSGHAYSTIEEYVRAAKAIGLKAFAVTDHGPAMPGAPHYYHFSNLRMLPRQINGITVFRGIEANIINDQGEIDIAEAEIKWGELDIVMVAMHPRCGYENQGAGKNTEVLLKAMKNPYINIIAHPGNPKYPVDIKTIVQAAKEKGILLEVNNSSGFSRPGSEGKCLDVIREVRDNNWLVAVGTDSHFSSMLGGFKEALKLIGQAGLPEKNVVNTSWDKIERYLLRKKTT